MDGTAPVFSLIWMNPMSDFLKGGDGESGVSAEKIIAFLSSAAVRRMNMDFFLNMMKIYTIN
jgi:hypothetical protein